MLATLGSETDPALARVSVVIGLVNNMPSKAARATERQFCRVLAAAAGKLTVGVRFFSLCGAGDSLTGHRSYGDLACLERTRLDGLIVTGAPPSSPDLRHEPSWPLMTQLIDLAAARRLPTVWSCLAAHAAALHLHGIARRPLRPKLSGLAECVRTQVEHPLMAGMPATWRVPHSRYNDLSEVDLVAKDYLILSRSPQAGADIFVHDLDAPFVFMQGHPEYEARTLLREYHRDVTDYLSGSREDYPGIPTGYFGQVETAGLERFRDTAMQNRHPDLLERLPLPRLGHDIGAAWDTVAVRLWTNWLLQLHAAPAHAGRVRAGSLSQMGCSGRQTRRAVLG